MSFYLDRVKNCFNKEDNSYEKVGSNSHSHHDGNRKYLRHVVELTLVDRTYQEENYKGFQIVIVGWFHSHRIIFKHDGTSFDYGHEIASDSDIGSYGLSESTQVFRAYAWEIGTEYDNVTELNWASANADIAGICATNSAIKTLALAKKKLDLRAKVVEQRERLIEISKARLSAYGNANNPYNAVVNEEVYIQAHGRLRKGVIVETTGSRFIVGYVTPSNHNQLKWKTLRLSDLWIDVAEKELLMKVVQP